MQPCDSFAMLPPSALRTPASTALTAAGLKRGLEDEQSSPAGGLPADGGSLLQHGGPGGLKAHPAGGLKAHLRLLKAGIVTPSSTATIIWTRAFHSGACPHSGRRAYGCGGPILGPALIPGYSAGGCGCCCWGAALAHSQHDDGSAATIGAPGRRAAAVGHRCSG